MGRLRRSGIALSTAFVLAATGLVTVSPQVIQQAGHHTDTPGQARPASGEPVVVPGRYLVKSATPADQARLLAEIDRVGATVLQSYDTLWSGVSVAATESQLEQIKAATGADSAYPVYQLQLTDPPSGEPTAESSPSVESPSPEAPAPEESPRPTGSETPQPDPTATDEAGLSAPCVPAERSDSTGPDQPTEAESSSASPTAPTESPEPAEPSGSAAPEPTESGEPTESAEPDPSRGPVAVKDTAETKQNVPVTLSPLDNDQSPSGPSLATLDPATLILVGEGVADGGKLAETDAGHWSIGDDATLTYRPNPSFVGVATIEYQVSDSASATASAVVEVTVTAVTPAALPDCAAVPAKHTARIDLLANDSAGDDTAPLDPSTVEFTSDAASAGGKSLTTPEGDWQVDSNGVATFTPADGFHGATAEAGYRVRDANGTAATASVSVRVGALTTTANTAGSTLQGLPIELAPLDQVTVGDDGNGNPGMLSPDSMVFTDPDALDSGRSLAVKGVGTWQIDGGRVSFSPEPTFTGEASAAFAITDSFGNTASATISVSVTPVTPNAFDDTANTPANHPVTIDVLENDRNGATSAPLDPSTLELLDSDPGTWKVTSDHKISFAPAKDFTGLATAKYQVLDRNGTTARGQIRVTVGALPHASDDTLSAPQNGKTLTINPLSNDLAGDDGRGAKGRGSLSASSVTIATKDGTKRGRTISTSSYTWAVGTDGKVTFSPDWRYTGTASITYQVVDSFGNSATASITVKITPTALTETEKRLTKIGALNLGDSGKGIKVGIIDSGVDYAHPDLGGSAGTKFPTSRVTTGYDFVDRDGFPMDCYGHGTKVAGVVGADGNPKLGGATGVAPKVTFGAYRVFDCRGNATTDNIIKAMERAAKDGMNVVNLSLGASSVSWPSDPLSQAAANLVKKGIVVVAAAGNSGANGLFTAGSPAVAPGVISLAAANNAGTAIESFSSMGLAADLSLSPTLSAPGAGVHTTALRSSYASTSGTSVAAPEVAGAVAQILYAKGWRTPAAGIPGKAAALLYGSATPITATASAVRGKPEGVFRQGAGLLNLKGALGTTVTASPSTLKLADGSSKTATVTLTNSSKTKVTYKVSAVTGASAAASTGSKTNLGSQTPDWAYAAVGFTASPSSVTVPAGGSAKVSVKITPSTKILAKKQGMLYGGWVKFTASGSQTVSVPFAGMRGTYQKVKLLPSANRTLSGPSLTKLKLPGLAYKSGSALKLTTSGTRTFRPGKTNGQPYVMFHLDFPASAIRIKAINQKTKKSYYAVLSGKSTQFGSRGRDESYTAIAFYGAYKNSKGKVVAVPAGTYKLQLRVLAPLGKSSKSSHWQTYTTRKFKLSWK